MRRPRFVVLDRDGTLIVERHYLSDPNDVELLPGVVQGMQRLRSLNLGLIVLTNQSGIGRKLFDDKQLAHIHNRLLELLHSSGIQLDGIYYCPHLPDDGCECRKPKTGLLLAAAKDLAFDPRESFVIGDKPCDIDLGKAVNATTILVRTGYGAIYATNSSVAADHVVNDLDAAAKVIERLLFFESHASLTQTGHSKP